jgi:hypothetical protein
MRLIDAVRDEAIASIGVDEILGPPDSEITGEQP